MNKYRPYTITVEISGRIENFDSGLKVQTFSPLGNKRTTEKSALSAVKNTLSLCGCKLEKIISIQKNI